MYAHPQQTELQTVCRKVRRLWREVHECNASQPFHNEGQTAMHKAELAICDALLEIEQLADLEAIEKGLAIDA